MPVIDIANINRIIHNGKINTHANQITTCSPWSVKSYSAAQLDF